MKPSSSLTGLGLGFWAVALSKARIWEFCGEAQRSGSWSNPLTNPDLSPISDATVFILLAAVDFPIETLVLFLFFRHPPPIGTFRRAPPFVQYRRQVLQKCRGCVRL
ncbi:hypothetical protein SLA2020_132540 [Shorea laevis]